MTVSSTSENSDASCHMKPCVIICPGGAYQHLSPRESEPVAQAFEKIGVKAEILRYTVRPSPKDDEPRFTPVRQLSERVRTVRDTCPGAPVLVCGFSAGAHAAATLGVHWRTMGLERPDAMILGYPVITADRNFIHEGSFENLSGNENREFFSLEKHVSADTPPAFLWHTAADKDVPCENSLLFAAALSKAGVPFELHIYPFGEHGLSLATKEVDQPDKGRLADAHIAGWMDECAGWLHSMKFL